MEQQGRWASKARFAVIVSIIQLLGLKRNVSGYSDKICRRLEFKLDQDINCVDFQAPELEFNCLKFTSTLTEMCTFKYIELNIFKL